MTSLWKSLKEWIGVSTHKPNQEVNRSQYSLVDGEVTAHTLRLWLNLPDEVKNDPALAPFKQLYEKEQAKPGKSTPEEIAIKRLPFVKSAPLLKDTNGDDDDIFNDDDIQCQDDEEISDPQPGDDDKASNKAWQRPKKTFYVKMAVLITCWMFFTVVFMVCDEKLEYSRSSAVIQGKDKDYILKINNNVDNLLVKLSGPFLTEQDEAKIDSKNMRNKVDIWFERRTLKSEGNYTSTAIDISNNWTILLQDDEKIDFNKGEPRSQILKLNKLFDKDSNHTYAIRIRTTSPRLTPFKLSYSGSSLDVSTGVIYAIILLCGLYILIVFEVINRTMAAITVATMSLAALGLVGERPSLSEIISWLDHETLLLLFSVMLLVAIMAETGVFDFLAVYTFEITKGKLWPLIYLLCGITAILSTVLDNVMTVLLMSPITIRLCEVMELDPVPILTFIAVYSNVGGTATPVGDPPNIIVVSNRNIIESGINLANFTAHMSVGVLFVFIQTTVQIKYMFRDTNKLRIGVPRDIQDIRHQLSIWRRAADSLPHLSKEVQIVREKLEKNMAKLTSKLDVLVKESHKRGCSKDTFESTLNELKGKYKLRDKQLLFKSSMAIFFVVFVFFLHSSADHRNLSLGWTSLLGAILLLILADREDLEPILHRVEWSTLLFFAAFFVLMEALSKLGLIVYVGGLMEQVLMSVDERARLAVAIILMLWVSGIISACIDNIPLTTMMIKVVLSIASNSNINLPMGPLIWALLFGACLGGNGSLIAASANVVCAGVAETHGYKISFIRFSRIGIPLMVGHLIVSTCYLLISHCVFTWH